MLYDSHIFPELLHNIAKFHFRIISIPFPTRRATFKEVKRVHEVLMTVEVHSETVEELKNKLINKPGADNQRGTGRNSSKNQSRKSQIRRSKSRESPIRKLPDFVQNLADEAASQSEDETSGVLLGSDLTEFENTKKKPSKIKTEHIIGKGLGFYLFLYFSDIFCKKPC